MFSKLQGLYYGSEIDDLEMEIKHSTKSEIYDTVKSHDGNVGLHEESHLN